jgi:hypothetical protein
VGLGADEAEVPPATPAPDEPTGPEAGSPAPAPAPAPEAAPEAIPAPPAATSPPTPAPAAAKPKVSDFIQTQVTFYIGDDNVLAGSSDRSPNAGMGNQYPEPFYEGLNSETQAVVNETELVLYGKAPGFIPHVDTEAAFVGEFGLFRDPQDNRLVGRFRDDGSWLAVTVWMKKEKKGDFLRLTAWPFSSNRFRLGYTYDLTWGGDKIFPKNLGPVPGIRLDLDTQFVNAFVGAKSLARVRADNNEVENFWGVLGGAGPAFDLGPQKKSRISYDFGAGYFARGTFQQDPFRSDAVQAFGFSHRIMWTHGLRMGASPDLKVLINDPDKRQEFGVVPSYEGDLGVGVSAELSTLWQTLIDPETMDRLLWDDAITGAVTAQVRLLKWMRVGGDLVYRDVSFLTFNVPGLTPYVGFAEGTVLKPQVYGAVWWDLFLDKPKLMPGFVFGLMQPASFQSLPDANGDRQTEVIREANDYEIMPDGVGPFTVMALKGSLRWFASKNLSMAGEITFTQDYNQSKRVSLEDGATDRVLDERRARALGFNLFMQARF